MISDYTVSVALVQHNCWYKFNCTLQVDIYIYLNIKIIHQNYGRYKMLLKILNLNEQFICAWVYLSTIIIIHLQRIVDVCGVYILLKLITFNFHLNRQYTDLNNFKILFVNHIFWSDIMFKRVLWNCLMSVTETIKTHTKNPKHIFDKKKKYIQKKKETNYQTSF